MSRSQNLHEVITSKKTECWFSTCYVISLSMYSIFFNNENVTHRSPSFAIVSSKICLLFQSFFYRSFHAETIHSRIQKLDASKSVSSERCREHFEGEERARWSESIEEDLGVGREFRHPSERVGWPAEWERLWPRGCMAHSRIPWPGSLRQGHSPWHVAQRNGSKKFLRVRIWWILHNQNFLIW